MENKNSRQFIFYSVEGLRFALPLNQVIRVVQAAEVTPLPGAPDSIQGIINVQGDIIPVFNTRKYLGFSEKSLDPGDYFLLVKSGTQPMAMWVTDVQNIEEIEPGRISRNASAPSGLKSFEGVIKAGQEMIYIQNAARFISRENGETLQEALLELKSNTAGSEDPQKTTDQEPDSPHDQ